MSPFTQLRDLTNPFNSSQNHATSIDRNLTSALSYLDEFDRHFSHRHRFMTCFIPRFDLEEDKECYYLFGDLPGARVEEVGIEVRDGNTLYVWGETRREAAAGKQTEGESNGQHAEGELSGKQVQVQVPHESSNGKAEEGGNQTAPAQQSQQPQPQLHHPVGQIQQGYGQGNTNPDNYQAPPLNNNNNNNFRVLLSERLVGEFNRTFAFPSPVLEEGIRASMEDGVLKIVVPKRAPSEKEPGRRVPVVRGGGWSGRWKGEKN